MSAQHTPGPWKVDFRQIGLVTAENGAEIAKCKRLTSLVNLQANAWLIATAPELLDELTKTVKNAEQSAFEDWRERARPSGDVEDVQRQWEHSVDFNDFCEEWKSQRAAIAKATGSAA